MVTAFIFIVRFIRLIRFIGLVRLIAACAFGKYSGNRYSLLRIGKRYGIFRYNHITCRTVESNAAFFSVLRISPVCNVRSVSQSACAVFEERYRIALHLLYSLFFNNFRKFFHIFVFEFNVNSRKSIRITRNVTVITASARIPAEIACGKPEHTRKRAHNRRKHNQNFAFHNNSFVRNP